MTADTSVVVPSLAAWHEHHEDALEAVGKVTCLPAHVLVETVSTLSRLPGGLAQTLHVALGLVREAFPDAPLTLPSEGYAGFLETLGVAGLGGGAVYDGLVGRTATWYGARLLSFDARARGVYHALGVDVGWLG